MNAFIVVCILLRSTYTRFKFSKISFTIRYLRERFLFNRAEICLYVSSSSLMLTYVIVIRSIEYQSTFAFNLLCIIDNQCSNFALFSINIVELRMTTDRFVFSKRSVALMFAIIFAMWFINDENDMNNDVIDFLTLRIRSWTVSRIFSFCFIVRRANFWSISSFCKKMFLSEASFSSRDIHFFS
jgi:hypothetical protein